MSKTILNESLYIVYMAKLYMHPSEDVIAQQLSSETLTLLREFLQSLSLFSQLTQRTNYSIDEPMGYFGGEPIVSFEYGSFFEKAIEEIVFHTANTPSPICYILPYGFLFNAALSAISNRLGDSVFPWELTTDEKEVSFRSAVSNRNEFADSGLADKSLSPKEQKDLALAAVIALTHEIMQATNGVPHELVASYLHNILGKLVGKQPSIQDCAKSLSALLRSHSTNRQELFGLFDILFYTLLNAPTDKGTLRLKRCPLCGRVFFPNGQDTRKYCPYIGNPAEPELTCSDAWTKTLRSRLYQSIKALARQIKEHNKTPTRRNDLELFDFRDYPDAKAAIERQFGKDKLRNMLAQLFFLCYWSLGKEALTTNVRRKKTPEGKSVDEIFDGMSLPVRFQSAIRDYAKKTESLKLPDATRFDTDIFNWLLNHIKTDDTEQ